MDGIIAVPSISMLENDKSNIPCLSSRSGLSNRPCKSASRRYYPLSNVQFTGKPSLCDACYRYSARLKISYYNSLFERDPEMQKLCSMTKSSVRTLERIPKICVKPEFYRKNAAELKESFRKLEGTSKAFLSLFIHKEESLQFGDKCEETICIYGVLLVIFQGYLLQQAQDAESKGDSVKKKLAEDLWANCFEHIEEKVLEGEVKTHVEFSDAAKAYARSLVYDGIEAPQSLLNFELALSDKFTAGRRLQLSGTEGTELDKAKDPLGLGQLAIGGSDEMEDDVEEGEVNGLGEECDYSDNHDSSFSSSSSSSATLLKRTERRGTSLIINLN
jgi:hypothetical protein